MNKIGLLFFLMLGFAATAQSRLSNYKTITLNLTKDTLQFSKVSVNPYEFSIKEKGKLIPKSAYKVDFGKGLLYIDSKKYSKIKINYTAYPEFLTKTYKIFDEEIIVPYRTLHSKKYKFNKSKKRAEKPFEGLNTQGSLVRGVTVGNNQDAVLNSTLDLQVSGKLSDKVNLRATISDSNIPIQKNGYSQNIEEFDRVYIELFSDYWNVQAGDVILNNDETEFLKFNKKVSGLAAKTHWTNNESKTNVLASGALVRGQFTRQIFTGVEGNQGPYKLSGPNGELFIIILSGSETVYVNGIPLKRGEQNDYTIDYNTAEITFTTTYPITANMRISTEFQYSDKNYTRFVTYNKAEFKTDKLKIGGYFYNENDSKNQPLQQNLSDEQKEILRDAGNDPSKMFASSGYLESSDENKIQYQKTTGGIFEYIEDKNNNEEYYNVNFKFVGSNKGAYVFSRSTPTGKIYEYIGTNQGDYNPLTQLVAPTKLQVALSKLSYKPTENTSLESEVAFSNNDANLFSNLDDEQNKGLAAKVNWTQVYANKQWLVKSKVNFDYLHKNFTTVQPLYNIEFSRDWGLTTEIGNQEFIKSDLELSNKKNTAFVYSFEKLNLGESYKGYRHIFDANMQVGNTSFSSNTRILENKTALAVTSFLRANATVKHHFKKSWIGTSMAMEDYQTKDKISKKLELVSQKFNSYDAFFGIGDSTKVFTKFGVNFRKNDSVKSEKLTEVNASNNYYIRSKLIQNKKTDLAIYANYRTVKNKFSENTTSLNSRINYRQKLFKNFINLSTLFETGSGVLPKQEFTYVKTEPGQGFYTWIDYNNNGTQEFNEFEVAKFSDQASYLRVALPSLNYIKIHQKKISQSLHLDFAVFEKNNGFTKIISQFYNQSYLLMDSKNERIGTGFDLNPFRISTDNTLDLQYNFKNSLFFRKALQKHSTTYIYTKSKVKSNLGIGFQENESKLNQLQYQHRIGFYWLLKINTSTNLIQNTSENFEERNYQIQTEKLNPSITFRHTKNTNFTVNYEYILKNESLNTSNLKAHKMGTEFQYSHPKKGALIADFNFHKNTYTGDNNTAISYQMLDGLQPGNNYIWNVILQKKLTKTLHLNVNYSGRKSSEIHTIHTGTVQVRANF
ncbi:hypothetical protein [Flavicella sediminum]|uniref:hypothetical protein n=1 Tax=Flavicella sediminum TaxID=2585141 RepID=UPI00111CCC15|nr:hypothetical protein [Flavicella sediminum]